MKWSLYLDMKTSLISSFNFTACSKAEIESPYTEIETSTRIKWHIHSSMTIFIISKEHMRLISISYDVHNLIQRIKTSADIHKNHSNVTIYINKCGVCSSDEQTCLILTFWPRNS